MAELSSDRLPRASITLSDVVGRTSVVTPWLAAAGAATMLVRAGASLASALLLAALAFAFVTLLCIAAADADLGLLQQGHAPSDAFADKTVLIVGASRGFGAALAQHLCRQGAVLILTSRSVEDLQVRNRSAQVFDMPVCLTLQFATGTHRLLGVCRALFGPQPAAVAC